MDTQGILYIATGEKFIRAAMHSAATVHKHSPGLSIHLFGDWHNYRFNFDNSPYPFTSVANIESPHRRSKVDYLPHTPYEKTLYLDTDTALNADVRPMFRVLGRFDIALAHAHRRNFIERLKPWQLELPQAFPQYNGGVILFRSAPVVIKFLEQWRDAYHLNLRDFQQDQRTLRELLWKSDLRIATLPPEYNVRYIKYHYLWSKGEAETKIFHLRRFHTSWFNWLFRPFTRQKFGFATKLGLDWVFNPKKRKR